MENMKCPRCEKCKERNDCKEADKFGWCDAPWITCKIKEYVKNKYGLTECKHDSLSEQLEKMGSIYKYDKY